MAERPHVIYVLSDEHRAQAMSHLHGHPLGRGDADVSTPHMDRMAAQGVSFATAFANCPDLHPQSRHNLLRPPRPRRADRGAKSLLAQRLSEHRPTTCAAPATAPPTSARATSASTRTRRPRPCGAATTAGPPAPAARPSDTAPASRSGTPSRTRTRLTPAPRSSTTTRSCPASTPATKPTVLTDLAIDHLRAYDAAGHDEPLFLVLSVLPPHFPLNVPDEWLRHDPATLTLRPNASDVPELRRNLARYYAMIENLDHNLGRLLDAVDRARRLWRRANVRGLLQRPPAT